ncbi:MAG: radical SAM protein, partial [Ferruginibacter sp.]
ASDRLLALIEKGITVAQVARVNKNFSEAGIMVHAYLMYGFPTQTAQETIDSLEMVRQLFESGILQSAFWHQFTMTAHSPVGLDPEKYQVRKLTENVGRFANNDIAHLDPTGADHESFSFGLKKSLFNYMHATCFEYPLQKWFDFKVPKTTVAPGFIIKALEEPGLTSTKPTDKIVWLGNPPLVESFTKSKKGSQWEMSSITFQSKKESMTIKTNRAQGLWLAGMLERLSVKNNKTYTVQEVKDDYESDGLEDFELFWDNKPISALYKVGLLKL